MLLALSLAFYCIGESWWVTAVGLYAPRLPFVLPLPFVIFALWAVGLQRFLWTQVIAAFLAIVWLMGFVFPSPVRARAGAPSLRVLSFNVNSGYGGQDAIAQAVFAESPDIVLLQEAPSGAGLADALRARFPYVQSSTQFIIASRYPILAASEPPRIPFFGRARSPRFMRYLLETPLGSVALYSVHPISPRGVLHVHQLRAALHQLRTGELFAGDPESDVKTNFGLRALQIEGAARSAAHESLPVLIVGDTNLPGLSAVLRRSLSSYTDGFRAAGWGFGYSFPTHHPFLRLDRILAKGGLQFSSFKIACQGVSDHLCVLADIQASQ